MTQIEITAAFYAYISGVWVLLDDVKPIRGEWGMADGSPLTRVAKTGELSLPLNNTTGQYSPGNPSALAGWKIGVAIKMVVTCGGVSRIRFRGRVSKIPITKQKDKIINIEVLDWMDYASRHPVVNPGIQTNQRADQVLTTLMSSVAIQPQAYSFDTGFETFPTSFDAVTSTTKAYTEFVKVALSELGHVYLKKDATYGETLRFESATSRHGWRTVDTASMTVIDPTTAYNAINEDGTNLINEDGTNVINDKTMVYSFDGQVDENFISDFSASYGDKMINRLTCYARPRRLSASPEVLFTLSAPIPIGAGQSVTIKSNYTNPSSGLPVNGMNMITPVATTDYLVYVNSDGTGTNLTASLSLDTITYGTEGFTHVVRNTNASSGYITRYAPRGTGVYMDNPIEHAANNYTSIAEFEAQSESINQAYKNDLASGSLFCDSVVDEHAQPRTVLHSISFCANKSSEHMVAFLYYDVGSIIYVNIPEIGIEGNYYIQGVQFSIAGGLIMVKWILVLALSLQYGLSPISIEFGQSASDRIVYNSVPRINNLSTVSVSTWIYANPAAATEVLFIWDGLTLGLSPVSKYLWWYQLHSVTTGVFQTPNNSISTGSWFHVVYMRDTSVSPSTAPVIYINGVSQAITTSTAPSGAVVHDKNVFQIGGAYSGSSFYGYIFDPRIYNRILTSTEVATLYNGGTPSSAALITSGLVFQGFNVRTENLASYTNQTLASTQTVRDNMYGIVGYPSVSPIGRPTP